MPTRKNPDRNSPADRQAAAREDHPTRIVPFAMFGEAPPRDDPPPRELDRIADVLKRYAQSANLSVLPPLPDPKTLTRIAKALTSLVKPHPNIPLNLDVPAIKTLLKLHEDVVTVARLLQLLSRFPDDPG